MGGLAPRTRVLVSETATEAGRLTALQGARFGAGREAEVKARAHAIRLLQRAGLVEIRNTMMNGVRGVEYRFNAKAMDYLSRYFEEIAQ